jgi:hypothetical protein
LRSDRYGREPPRVPGPSADANCEGGHWFEEMDSVVLNFFSHS